MLNSTDWQIFQVKILLDFCILIKASYSNLAGNVLSPKENYQNVKNHISRACVQVMQISCSHEQKTLNKFKITNILNKIFFLKVCL